VQGSNQPEVSEEQAMSDKNKPLEIAQSVEKKVRKIVDEMFQAAEVDRKKDEKAYFLASNTIFAAVSACAAQRMLEDGLMTGRLRQKTGMISGVARDLFLANHPEIAAKIAEEKKAQEAKWAQEGNDLSSDGSDEDQDEEPDDND
jgi:hypothetical protein